MAKQSGGRRNEMAQAGVVDERARFATGHPNTAIAGHHDVYARLDDMNNDGVAAEVIYQFSQNGEPMPLVSDPGGGLGTVPDGAFELGAGFLGQTPRALGGPTLPTRA